MGLPRTAASSALTFNAILSLKIVRRRKKTEERNRKLDTYFPTASLIAAWTIGILVLPPVRMTEVISF
jgi:hypothetical protein